MDMTERQREDMAKRPSLFRPKSADDDGPPPPAIAAETTRPPSRAGKRVLSIYLDPLAWRQLRQLALDNETTTQALGEEAVNLLFEKHGLNRSA